MIYHKKPGKNDRNNWYSEQTKLLIVDQQGSWPLFARNYQALQKVETRTIDFGSYTITIQHNPERLISSTADVEPEALSRRNCFLCLENLFEQQNGLTYKEDYLILSNPFPIFPEHFTIAKSKHIPQSIFHNFEVMLEAARDFCSYYSLFYNGPNCGASAPDHMHFQASTKNFTVTEREYSKIISLHTKQIYCGESVEVRFIENYLRYLICIEGRNKAELIRLFKKFYMFYEKITDENKEPMMNIACSYSDNFWRVFIFPRRAHRPFQFYEKGSKQIVISPAYIDMCGLLILPRREDFDKITKEDIVSIYNQITIDKERFEFLKIKTGSIFNKD